MTFLATGEGWFKLILDVSGWGKGARVCSLRTSLPYNDL